jgi:hypothetical protein
MFIYKGNSKTDPNKNKERRRGISVEFWMKPSIHPYKLKKLGKNRISAVEIHDHIQIIIIHIYLSLHERNKIIYGVTDDSV